MEISLRAVPKTAKDKTNGLDLALIGKTEKVRGAQIGLGNYAEDSSYGAQIGGINYAEDSSYGAQIGLLLNICRRGSVLQAGLINYRIGAPWYAKIIPLVAIRSSKEQKGLENKLRQ